jgi:hypothetical protein
MFPTKSQNAQKFLLALCGFVALWGAFQIVAPKNSVRNYRSVEEMRLPSIGIP